MKRHWYAFGIVLALLVLGGAWFLTTHERVMTKVWTGPSAAARANPYLAAMRFTERLGMTASATAANRPFEGLAPRAALLLPERRNALSAQQVRTLEQWIRSGGHAIVEPEPERELDRVLDHFGVRRTAPKRAPESATTPVLLPGMSDPIVVSQAAAPLLAFERHAPDILIAADHGTTLASMPLGAGRLTIVAGMAQRFQNRTIGKNDNAELLHRILTFAPGATGLVVMRLPQALPLWGWLRDHALPTLSATLILLLLGLARVLPRFGPVQTDAPAERRRLREHILAAGRFRWSHGGRDGLLVAARDVAARQTELVHPRLAQLPPSSRWRELAARTGLQADAIENAFTAEARSAREFVHIVGTLASIHARLGRTPGPRPATPRST